MLERLLFGNLKTKYELHLQRMKLMGANTERDIEFFLRVIQHDHVVYGNYIFMPSRQEYMTKLISIGFGEYTNKEIPPKQNLHFKYMYNPELNISVHIVPSSQWDSINAAIDVMRNIFIPSDSEFNAIRVIYEALSSFKKPILQNPTLGSDAVTKGYADGQ